MPDPTRVEGADDSERRAESTTADAPVRWSGAAPVPAGQQQKKSWLPWRRAAPADEDDWELTPAVDPWADQDTPWPLVPPPTAPVLPPTRIDAPATPPPTRVEAPVPPPPAPAPVPAPVAVPVPVPANPAPAPAKQPSGWSWRRRTESPAPVNRLPVQPRPAPSAYRPPSYPPPLAARPPAPPMKPAPFNRPPAGPPPRRRRRWPRRLFMFTLLSAVCCCGIPAYFAWPAAQQYPVSATLPSRVSDLSLRDDSSSKRAADQLSQQLSDSDLAGQNVFAGVYADGNGKRVTIFGTTGLRLNPKQDVEAELDHLSTDYKITDIATYDLGETGVHERCGVGRSGGKAVVVCAWADHGSLATVLLTRRNVSESAQLVGVLRSAVLTRG